MKKWLAVFLMFVVQFCLAQNTDIPVNGANTYTVIGQNLVWGKSGPGSMNNNFIFTPTTADTGICIYITNLNTSSGHSFSLAMSQTGDPTVTSFVNNGSRWTSVAIFPSTTFPVTISANSTQGFFYKTFASAVVALQITGSTTSAGSPDTANVFAVQTSQSNCGINPSNNAVVGPTLEGSATPIGARYPVLVGGWSQGTNTATTIRLDPNNTGYVLVGTNNGAATSDSPLASWSGVSLNNIGTSNFLNIMNWGIGSDTNVGFILDRNSARYGKATSDSFAFSSSSNSSKSYYGQNDTTNPGAGAVLLHVYNTATTPIALRRITVSCSAICDVLINTTNSTGTTCTAETKANSNPAGPASVASTVLQSGCTVAPTVVNTIRHVNIRADDTQVFDMTGFWNGATANNGFDVVQGAALTGVASVAFEWMER